MPEQNDNQVMALRIRDWDPRFEVNNFKREFVLGQGQQKRKLPLPFVRRPSLDMGRTEEWQEFLAVAGPWHAERCEGFYYALAAMAAKKQREHRGWILNRRLEPMGIPEIAAARGTPVELVAYDIEILIKMKLIAWENCPFAVDWGQPVKMSLSAGDIMNCESLQNVASFANGLKQNQNIEQNLNSDIRACSSYDEKNEEKNLRGSPAPGSEYLKSEDLKSERGPDGGPAGGGLENTEGSQGEAAEGSEDLKSEDLTGAGGGRRAKGPLSLGEEKTEISQFLPVSFNEQIKQIEALGQLDTLDPNCLLDGVSRKTEMIFQQHVICRGWLWITKLFPEILTPGPQTPQKVQEQAKGSYTTFMQKMTDIWDSTGELGIVEVVKFAQERHREYRRPRSRIRDPVAIVVAEMNRKIKAHDEKNKSPPGGKK